MARVQSVQEDLLRGWIMDVSFFLFVYPYFPTMNIYYLYDNNYKYIARSTPLFMREGELLHRTPSSSLLQTWPCFLPQAPPVSASVSISFLPASIIYNILVVWCLALALAEAPTSVSIHKLPLPPDTHVKDHLVTHLSPPIQFHPCIRATAADKAPFLPPTSTALTVAV